MLKSCRASSISSSASVSASSANPAITSTIGGMSSVAIDRSATSTLSFRNLGTVPTVSVTEKKKEKDRPTWKRLTRKISKTFSGSSKKNKGGMLMLTAPPTVDEDERSGTHKEKQSTVEKATPTIVLSHVGLSRIDAPAPIQDAAQFNINPEDSVIDDGRTENASNTVEETDQSRGDTGTQPGVEALPKPSSQFLALIDSIPVDFPLIRYIAECLLMDRVPPSMPSVFSPNAGGDEEQQRTKDVESQLFFKCLELQKWTLAQTLAEKMQRRVAFQHQYHRRQRKSGTHSSSEASDAHSERIHSGSSAIREEEALDAHDVILNFLDTCSS